MKGDLLIDSADAYEFYGMELGETAISSILCPPENKEMIRNESRLTAGVEYMTAAAVPNERSLTIEAFIRTKNLSEMYTKLDRLYNEVFKKGFFTLKIKEIPNKTFTFKYESFRQFSQFNGKLAVFMLSVTEPDPSKR